MFNPQITIIGAGPTGLFSAINLAKSGISLRIFESKIIRSQLSRALAIHAGTLEILAASHPELLKEILARGKKIRKLKFGKKYELDAGLIPSKYNFVLSLEQEETEEILENYLAKLGVKIERGCEIIDAKQGEKVTAVIKKDEEKFETISDYLLDCSGAHSVIRKNILKLSFKGEKYFGKIVMGDVKIISGIDQDCGLVFSNQNNLGAILPLNHKNYFRVILIPHQSLEIPEVIDINFFKNLTKKIIPEIELSSEFKWLTQFEISKRMVEKLKVGNIFLLGDAAHIHSPVGGQGMNLGLQDSFNICNKLRKVLRENADKKILENYQKERLPIIADILKMTNAAMQGGIEKSFFSQLLILIMQKLIAPIFFKSKFLQKKLLIRISQIKSARQEIARLSA